ncbi:MAG: GT4 family glycosyltransferase PelF [Acidobacteriota bacterium]
MTKDSKTTAPLSVSAFPIRVVHIVTTLKFGGLEKVVLDLVRHRNRERIDARVICLDSSGVLAQGFADVGVPVETIGTDGPVPRRVLKLARRLKELKPDVVHTHNPQAQLHGAWAALLGRVPVVVHTKHGRGSLEGRALGALSRLATTWTSCVVTVSEDAAQVAREIDHVPAERLRVIRNGVDLERFGASQERKPRIGARAITVGRLDPVKDQATLLRAARLVVAQVPAFQLDIVGDGPSRPELEALSGALGLNGSVHFLGYRDPVTTALAEADIFVLSSVSEGVSIALLEAMAMGLPVVATDVGGNREVVVPGETGWLVPASSPESLAAAMMKLLSDASALERMGLAARRRVEAHFNLRHVVDQYEHLYNECLGRSTRVS